MGTFDIHTTGLAAIEKKMKRLEKKVAGKIVKKSLREGAKFMQKAQKTSVKSLLGGSIGKLIADNIIVRSLKQRKSSHGVRTLIDPKETSFVYYSKGKRYYIPTAIEYGHAFPGRGGGKGSPKDVKPNGAFRSAFDANEFIVQRIVKARILLGVEDEVRKL